jgi:hypothetical protein
MTPMGTAADVSATTLAPRLSSSSRSFLVSSLVVVGLLSLVLLPLIAAGCGPPT